MNAKKEFLLHVGDPSVVKCVTITKRSYDNLEEFPDETLTLSVGHSAEDMFKFISLLDFEYNEYDNFIVQELIGTIWYHDGTWSIRDGNDDFNGYWRHMFFPEIPENLKQSIS
jgi:hypothetical protein